METDSLNTRLMALRVDDRSIRLDCTSEWLRTHQNRLSVCGVHLATHDEMARGGFREHAIVPDAPVPLATEHLEAITQFVAAPETPAGLCLGFGRLPSSDQLVADASEEAAKQDFLPHHGSRYALGPYSGRLVDVLPALPGTRTTTVDDPRTARYSESERAHKVGMHLDNAWTRGGEGERYACSVRVASADRRIIHNMGPGNRSIVVALNMSSQYLSDSVSPGNGQHIPTSKNLRDFLAENPDELSRVVCVVWTIEVGDLVVLPAGTAMHDGSMEGHREASHALVFAGSFPRRAFSDM